MYLFRGYRIGIWRMRNNNKEMLYLRQLYTRCYIYASGDACGCIWNCCDTLQRFESCGYAQYIFETRNRLGSDIVGLVYDTSKFH